MRVEALAKQEVGDFLSKYCVAAFDKIGTFQVAVGSDGKTAQKNGGNVAAFFCTPGGYVIHAVAGPRTAEAFLAEAKWAVAVYSDVLPGSNLGATRFRFGETALMAGELRKAHAHALEAMTNPFAMGSHLDLVRHEPPADGRKKGLDDAGRKQREKVHRLLQTKAFEPLARVGPEIYQHVLGERVTEEAVHLSGQTEARQAGRAGESVAEFFATGGSGTAANARSSATPSGGAAASSRRSSQSGRR